MMNEMASAGSPALLSTGDYRDAMARLGAAVNIITTDGPGGPAGFTASAVCSVTDTPPMLLVCLNRGSSAYPAFTRNSAVCVNTLASRHEDLSRIFGGKTPMPTRFAAASWHAGTTGAPILDDAAVSFDCVVRSVNAVGTHDVFFCEVLAVARGQASEALFYCSRRYHAIPYS